MEMGFNGAYTPRSGPGFANPAAFTEFSATGPQ